MNVAALEHRGGWRSAFPAGDGPSTLVLAFGPSALLDDPTPLQELRAAYPRAVVVGCSSAGEILGDRVSDDTLAVAVAAFEQTRLAAAVEEVGAPTRSREVGRALAERLRTPDLAAVLVLSDGLVVNGTELVRGFADVLPPSVVVSGGLAGDGPRFGRTWVYDGERPRSGAVVAVGLSGAALRVGHGSRGGWDVFGPERRITRSSGNVLFELDHRPALDLYEEYLGERAAGLPATGLLFPLCLHGRDGRRLVRTILSVDREARSLTFAGDVPVGATAQLMRANFERLVSGAADAGELTADGVAGPRLVVAVSCVGRRLVLGERVEEEVEATRAAFPAGAIQAGFYSYGELSPAGGGVCELHNQTMTLTSYREDPSGS